MAEDSSRDKKIKMLEEDIDDLQKYIEEFTSFLPIAVCDVSPINIIIGVNRTFQELTGYKEIDAIIGKPLATIFLEKEKLDGIIAEIFKKSAIKEKELTLFTQDKRKIPVSVSAALRKDKKRAVIGYFFGITDISELKEFQAKLEEKVKERTKELMEASAKAREERNKTLSIISDLTDGLLVFDKNDALSLINPQAEKMLEVQKTDVLGKSLVGLYALPNFLPFSKIFDTRLRELLRKEVKIKENFILEVSAIATKKQKKNTGFIVILHDISREKLVEKMKTEFVSLAAHQLRTPLSAIKWSLKNFLSGDLGKMNSKQQEQLGEVYKSNERMIDLIDDLLDVTRIEEGRYLYNLVSYDVCKIAKAVIARHKDRIAEKKIELSLQHPKCKLPEVMIDVEKMELAINNLIENAVRYTASGGKIIVSLKKTDDKIEFSIKDSGIGIPRDQQKRVFEKFFRGSNAVKIETEGTGLGLFIAKNIIEAHGGRIWFESEEKKGTTFYFSIPLETSKKGVLPSSS